MRVAHISATAFGGGVSEILYTLVPLMNDLGLDCEWQVIYGREEFFNATKLLHNALQGAETDVTEEQWDIWWRYNEMNARELPDGWDICLVHDPQPAALYDARPGEVARLGLALSPRSLDAQPERHRALAPHVQDYPQSLFHMAAFVPEGMRGPASTSCRRPSIRSRRRTWRSRATKPSYVCDQLGIDTARPLICQVSRFDPWKDPLGVIDAYRDVKSELPDVQLALVGLDGERRSRRLGLLQRHARPCQRRSRRAHPQQLQQRRRG